MRDTHVVFIVFSCLLIYSCSVGSISREKYQEIINLRRKHVYTNNTLTRANEVTRNSEVLNPSILASDNSINSTNSYSKIDAASNRVSYPQSKNNTYTENDNLNSLYQGESEICCFNSTHTNFTTESITPYRKNEVSNNSGQSYSVTKTTQQLNNDTNILNNTDINSKNINGTSEQVENAKNNLNASQQQIQNVTKEIKSFLPVLKQLNKNFNFLSGDNSLSSLSDEPLISEPVPIKYFNNKELPNPFLMLPIKALQENKIKPVIVELTRYKNESALILNKTISANQTVPANLTSTVSVTRDDLNENVTLPSLPSNLTSASPSSPSNTASTAPLIGPDVYSGLITNLKQDVLNLWPYKDYIKTPSDLMLDQGLINRAKLNIGSGQRLQRLFERAVKGQNVHAALISSSVSRAFFKDPASKRWLYPNALVHWWGKVVSPVTRSQIDLQDVSISGVGSDYFSRCLRSHLQDSSEPNLILWELSGSDYKPGGKLRPVDAESLENFLRNALEYKSRPEVVLLNFFRGNHLNKSAYCRELDEGKEAKLAAHYDCTALSWSKSVCPYLSDDEEGFSYSYLFSRDQMHPSIIGHAQMAYILIDYIRDEFLKFLQEMHNSPVYRVATLLPLPKALFSQDYKSLCYSSLKAVDDPPDSENSNLPVIFISPEPYENAAHRSVVAKYMYKPTVKSLIIRFTVPGRKKDLSKRTLALMPYFSKAVRTMVRVDNHEFTELKINRFNRGKIIKVQPSVMLGGGDHMLRIWSLDKKFKILALTIDSL